MTIDIPSPSDPTENSIESTTAWVKERLSEVQTLKDSLSRELIGGEAFEIGQAIDHFFEGFPVTSRGPALTEQDERTQEIENGRTIRDILLAEPEGDAQSSIKKMLEYLLERHYGPEFNDISLADEPGALIELSKRIRNIEIAEEPTLDFLITAEGFLDRRLIGIMYLEKMGKLSDKDKVEVAMTRNDFEVSFVRSPLLGKSDRDIHINIFRGNLLFNQEPAQSPSDVDAIRRTLEPLEGVVEEIKSRIESDPQIIESLRKDFVDYQNNRGAHA